MIRCKGQVYELSLNGENQQVALLAQVDDDLDGYHVALMMLGAGNPWYPIGLVENSSNIPEDTFIKLCSGWDAKYLGDFDKVFKRVEPKLMEC